MTTIFPSLKPTSRQVRLGQYPVKRFTNITGTGTTRIYGSQPFGSEMDLSFDNIKDVAALLIAECYDAARGSTEGLTLPSTIWSGMELNLSIKLERDYIWRFAEAPQVVSGVPGISSVIVKLEGQRDG